MKNSRSTRMLETCIISGFAGLLVAWLVSVARSL